ncbi:uncharacterized protein LOC134441135 [Engraulis encrasicolus]|uniref:uncharacterized protein LOC134441135 n=1 Tax=Engraulis encrasicolus TaxID=184585 RepID=UPI002FD14E4D
MWLTEPHPTQEDGIVTREVCGHFGSNCCFHWISIRVKMCPGNYAVYELQWILIVQRVVREAEKRDGVEMEISDPASLLLCCCDTVQEDGIVAREVCGHAGSNCCSLKIPSIRVKMCPGNYAVYELVRPKELSPAPTTQDLTMTTPTVLEGCCICDYVTVYDGPSTGYSQLGKLCHNSSQAAFHSSSNHLTVLFRSDNSGVSRGFQAEFISSLSTDDGQVQCSGDNMKIVISRAFLRSQGYDNGNDLYVNDEHCRPSITSYQVIFNFPLNRCGTFREFKGGRVIYHNAVRAYRSSIGEITRQSTFKLSAVCHMDSDSVSQIMYIAHERPNFNITGTGRFNTTMAFYATSSFHQQVYGSPYYVELNENVYVQVSLRRPDSSLAVFLDTCVASPNPHDHADHRSYDIVVNGCPRDDTYRVYTAGTQPYARFSFQAFKFLRTHNTVYLQCNVFIGPADVNNSRYGQGCQRRVARNVASPGDHSEILVLGPIKLRAEEPDPCDHYTVLNDTWRSTTNQDQSVLKCDGSIQFHGWYRMFYEGQSVRMPDSCVPKRRCGTHAPLWLNGTHPKPEDGIVTRRVCGSWDLGCCQFQSTPIRVKMCPGNYAVYELVSPYGCYVAYCADVPSAPTTLPTTPVTTDPTTTTAGVTHDYTCQHGCGYDYAMCSCSYRCREQGNCCFDYDDYCHPTSTTTTSTSTSATTTTPPSTTAESHPPCGGDLSGSGTFSSPYYPNYYHGNAYCVWRLSAPSGQRVLLTFTDLELDRCCSCDYITVHDGPSTGSRQLVKICHNSSQAAFHSSSNHLTVVFRSDKSGVSRGFQAEFISSLSSDNGEIQCSGDNMNIVISRAFLRSQGYDNDYDLYVNDEHCRPSKTSNQVIFNFPLNRCGTVRKVKGGQVIYHNAVRAYRANAGEITRQSTFMLSAVCHMDSDSVSQTKYIAHEKPNFTITGTGHYNTTMTFYASSSFRQQVHDRPYYVKLNEKAYVQVSLRRPDSSLVLFLDTCVASPNPHDHADHRSYDIVVNGCPRDATYRVYTNGTQPYARFSFQAFKFLRTHNTVYLQCKVLICPANDDNKSRCRQGCQRRKTRSLASTGHHTDTLVLGPIKLRDPKKPVAEQLEDLVAKAEESTDDVIN